MEGRKDLGSILPFIPLIQRSSALLWPSPAEEALKALSLGPDLSRVDSGEVFFDAILDLRDALGLSDDALAFKAANGYALFFDKLMSRMDSRMWFGEVVPELARLLLRLPSLLETHYQDLVEKFEEQSGLRIMGQQESGIVFLSQELIAALLTCSLFCLFPMRARHGKDLPSPINFDYLFAALHANTKQSQEQKIRCLIHYFERVCLRMPTGYVSFERKVLSVEPRSDCITYPKDVFWRNSSVPLCSFEVFPEGFIEDQNHEALEVDFANEFLGGGALVRGCVQEEIRFMINPELIAGMLFMASMEGNEAIEIVGAERFSSYIGYGFSFRFVGDFLDQKPSDLMGRRKTRIVAIDALDDPRLRQYTVEGLLRETNKAFCGFSDQSNYQCYHKIFQGIGSPKNLSHQYNREVHNQPPNIVTVGISTSTRPEETDCTNNIVYEYLDIGIATGNWGCGAFGGDPEIKSMIQWLAASQALRPFIHYYTFGDAALQRLEQVTRWILLHGWTVGDLWSILMEYSAQRLNREINIGFFSWLLPRLNHSIEDSSYMSE
ncbi:poly(ADP-ribose) glycohydrolase protein [Dioscorea alata]|uniref:Poly(ADP-ribose) glycohydrolase protein n=1 Tax=Dioscorea alata TaxID=55571 RepID=A0ACB7WBL0_DIOAL|nr:poly(ADP-ribose) glycohydrolase protein [Dioscorea alata]